jgi:hypothetical protein
MGSTGHAEPSGSYGLLMRPSYSAPTRGSVEGTSDATGG